MVASLVNMLGATDVRIQASAAGAISGLVKANTENQVGVVRSGAVTPLCTLVREGTSAEVKEQSAAALWSLSVDNAPNKATIAKLGGIEPLVGLLVTGETVRSHECSVGALSSLCSRHTENRETVAKLLVMRLTSRIAMVTAPGGAVRVLKAIAILAADSSANQTALAKAGGIPPLITWLSGTLDSASAQHGASTPAHVGRGFNEEAQREAVCALLSIATSNTSLQALIARSGGIPPLIHLVAKSGSLQTQEYAASSLWHLAGNAEVGAIIADAGGIVPIIMMLNVDSVHAQELAAVIIARLARSQPLVVPRTVAQVGGIVPLVRMLQIGSSTAQQQAAAALAEVCRVGENRALVADAEGIAPLVALLSSPEPATAEIAARALAHLAEDEPEATCEQPADNVHDGGAGGASVSSAPSAAVQSAAGGLPFAAVDVGEGGGGGGDVHAQAVATADDARGTLARWGGGARRRAIAGAGGVQRLVEMLSMNKPMFRRASGELDGRATEAGAALAMWRQVASVIGFPWPEDAEPPKGANQIEFIGTQEQAALTLAELALGDGELQQIIIAEEAIPRLLTLIRHGSPLAQEHAARAVWHLCEHTCNQGRVVEGGAIADLVLLCKGGSIKGQELGAAVLSDLAKGAIEVEPPAVERLHVIADAGGIAPLVKLVMTGNQMSREQAASALWHLSVDENNKVLIARAGGIAPIVQLLDDGTSISHGYALEIVNKIADNNPENQGLIAKKLVALLTAEERHGGTHERAAHMLWELSLHHPTAPLRTLNAGAISPLVDLLANGSLAAKEQAMGALLCLAYKEPSNQLAIATGLVALVGVGSCDSQEFATRMLLEFATRPSNRKAIAEAGAVKLLVAQLRGASSSSPSSSSSTAAGAGAGAGATSLRARELAVFVLALLVD